MQTVLFFAVCLLVYKFFTREKKTTDCNPLMLQHPFLSINFIFKRGLPVDWVPRTCMLDTQGCMSCTLWSSNFCLLFKLTACSHLNHSRCGSPDTCSHRRALIRGVVFSRVVVPALSKCFCVQKHTSSHHHWARKSSMYVMRGLCVMTEGWRRKVQHLLSISPWTGLSSGLQLRAASILSWVQCDLFRNTKLSKHNDEVIVRRLNFYLSVVSDICGTKAMKTISRNWWSRRTPDTVKYPKISDSGKFRSPLRSPLSS